MSPSQVTTVYSNLVNDNCVSPTRVTTTTTDTHTLVDRHTVDDTTDDRTGLTSRCTVHGTRPDLRDDSVTTLASQPGTKVVTYSSEVYTIDLGVSTTSPVCVSATHDTGPTSTATSYTVITPTTTGRVSATPNGTDPTVDTTSSTRNFVARGFF